MKEIFLICMFKFQAPINYTKFFFFFELLTLNYFYLGDLGEMVSDLKYGENLGKKYKKINPNLEKLFLFVLVSRESEERNNIVNIAGNKMDAKVQWSAFKSLKFNDFSIKILISNKLFQITSLQVNKKKMLSESFSFNPCKCTCMLFEYQNLN